MKAKIIWFLLLIHQSVLAQQPGVISVQGQFTAEVSQVEIRLDNERRRTVMAITEDLTEKHVADIAVDTYYLDVGVVKKGRFSEDRYLDFLLELPSGDFGDAPYFVYPFVGTNDEILPQEPIESYSEPRFDVVGGVPVLAVSKNLTDVPLDIHANEIAFPILFSYDEKCGKLIRVVNRKFYSDYIEQLNSAENKIESDIYGHRISSQIGKIALLAIDVHREKASQYLESPKDPT